MAGLVDLLWLIVMNIRFVDGSLGLIHDPVVYFFDQASFMLGVSRNKSCFITELLPVVAHQLQDVHSLQRLEVQFLELVIDDTNLRFPVTHGQLQSWSTNLGEVCKEANDIYEVYDPYHTLWFSGVYRPVDCEDILIHGERMDGVYTVYPTAMQHSVDVYCDMTTDGGGWLVFQRRQDGSVDFYRDWLQYTMGFGNFSGEFWLGNNILHLLSTQRASELRIDMMDFDEIRKYAVYRHFAVANETSKYQLTVSGYLGDAGDALHHHDNAMFTTKEQDNDLSNSNCATLLKSGGWWFNECYKMYADLNGRYSHTAHVFTNVGIIWYDWHAENTSLKWTEMKIRPIKTNSSSRHRY